MHHAKHLESKKYHCVQIPNKFTVVLHSLFYLLVHFPIRSSKEPLTSEPHARFSGRECVRPQKMSCLGPHGLADDICERIMLVRELNISRNWIDNSGFLCPLLFASARALSTPLVVWLKGSIFGRFSLDLDLWLVRTLCRLYDLLFPLRLLIQYNDLVTPWRRGGSGTQPRSHEPLGADFSQCHHLYWTTPAAPLDQATVDAKDELCCSRVGVKSDQKHTSRSNVALSAVASLSRPSSMPEDSSSPVSFKRELWVDESLPRSPWLFWSLSSDSELSLAMRLVALHIIV